VLQAAGKRYVLRKKPPGKVLASAHAVEREFRVLEALGGTEVPVPVARALCTNPAVLGTPFYVMDHVEVHHPSHQHHAPACTNPLYLHAAAVEQATTFPQTSASLVPCQNFGFLSFDIPLDLSISCPLPEFWFSFIRHSLRPQHLLSPARILFSFIRHSPRPQHLLSPARILVSFNRQGEIFVDPAMPSATSGERRAAYTAMAQTLASLHNVNFRTVGLQKFGRQSGYCSRQVMLSASTGYRCEAATSVCRGGLS